MREASVTIPRWYQDLSIPQMRNVFSLGDFMRADYAERVTERTRRALGYIGVTSTFVKITPQRIKKLSRLTDLDPVKFLSEMYRIVTGKYFTDEEYKKSYDCNERIILSAIAFLTLPETVVELHHRIPMGATPIFPPKPVRPKIGPRVRKESPYMESLFTRPDWLTYEKELYLWRKQCEEIPKPRAILPPFSEYPKILESNNVDERDAEEIESNQLDKTDKGKDHGRVNEKIDKARRRVRKLSKGESKSEQRHVANLKFQRGNKTDDKIGKTNKLFRGETKSGEQRGSNGVTSEREKKNHDKIGGATNKLPVEGRAKSGEKPRQSTGSRQKSKIHPDIGERKKLSKVEYGRAARPNLLTQQQCQGDGTIVIGNSEINESPGRSRQTRFDKKLYRDEKDKHLIVTSVLENDDSTDFSISYGTSGIACVTPENSDESFFQALNLAEPKKSYPRGRENLSRNWQEWFQNIDEEFIKVAKEANEIMKSVEGTLKLMGPEAICDGCCSCRQTRKANIKYHKTKTPRMVIDSITMDREQNKYVIGSLAMNSPAPSPSESTDDLPEVINSYDKITKNNIISGVTNEKGEMSYYISGVAKEIEHVPRKIVSDSRVKKEKKNVPPCGCAIEKMINEGSMEITSDDNIPWTRGNESCVGKIYRPRDIGASSCRDYPNDKTCRRNPFKKKIDEQIRAKLRERENFGKDDNYPPEKKNMYSLAAFQPCGDEDGMAVCGGPWGAVNIPDEEEIARREAEAKLIRESPPCGDKPGRAICGGPFGSRHPVPKKPKRVDEDEDEEEEEEEDEEPEEKRKRTREPRQKAAETRIEKLPNRDSRCSSVADKTVLAGKLNETESGPGVKTTKHRKAKSARSDKAKKSSRNSNERDPTIENNIKLKSNKKSPSDSSESEKLAKFRRKISEKGNDQERKPEDEETRRKYETEKLKNDWKRMKITASKFIVRPVIIPEDKAACKREFKRDCCDNKEVLPKEFPEESPKEGPFGWRTKSERALPAEKTLLYLVEPGDPMEKIPVRPGGKPCECRENRNAKKILLYNVAGLARDGKVKRGENVSRVIDGLIYITPIPSVRNSEEYVPEYELSESPYDKCSRERRDDNFKYIERYLGPKSLMKKQPRGSTRGCDCSIVRENIVGFSRQESTDNERQLSLSRNEEQLSRALRDQDLIEFYSRCRDNVPCWLRCVEFSKDGCCTYPRTLRVKRPVCECKYERKILRREEEKKKWLDRQERLKSHKKQPRIRVEGLSRPMKDETTLVISDVKRIPRRNRSDDLRYCVAGVKQDRVMTPGECVVSGIGMYTPVETPDPSKEDLPIAREHRHWSPMDIPGTNFITGNAEKSPGTGRTNETNWREKIRDKPDDKRVDVLFQSAQRGDEDHSKIRDKIDARMVRDKNLGKNIHQEGEKDVYRNKGKYDERRGKEKDEMHRGNKGEDDVPHGKAKNETRRDKEKNTRDSATKDDAFRNVERDAEVKNLPSVSHMQQPREHEPPGPAARTESRNKLLERDLGQGNKSNVHVRKSTGSVVAREKNHGSHDKKKDASAKTDFKQLLEIELGKMANEDFLFAKLPDCHRMPQLQYWIMYRKGIALSPKEKDNLMKRSIKLWKSIESKKPKKMKAPSLQVPKGVMKHMSWDKADEVKREVALKTELFYSNLRKSRVLKSRAMWGLMEFGKFPGVTFKRAFFTYQASKESDGFVFRPWENSEKSEES